MLQCFDLSHLVLYRHWETLQSNSTFYLATALCLRTILGRNLNQLAWVSLILLTYISHLKTPHCVSTNCAVVVVSVDSSLRFTTLKLHAVIWSIVHVTVLIAAVTVLQTNIFLLKVGKLMVRLIPYGIVLCDSFNLLERCFREKTTRSMSIAEG